MIYLLFKKMKQYHLTQILDMDKIDMVAMVIYVALIQILYRADEKNRVDNFIKNSLYMQATDNRGLLKNMFISNVL